MENSKYKKIDISKNVESYVFQGFGTSLCWWANIVGKWEDEAKIHEICRLVFDEKDGLGMNIVRYNFGGVDGTTRTKNYRRGAIIESYDRGDGKLDMSFDYGQRKILSMAKDYGVNIFEAFVNSPPQWMLITDTTAGGNLGENNLSIENEENYVKYMMKVMQELWTTYELKFDFLSPFNEPSSVWWTTENNQEGCHFSVESQSRILSFIEQTKNEVAYDFEISGPEGWSVHESISMFNAYSPKAKEVVGHLSTHTYFADEDRRKLIRKIANEYKKDLWMSEVCYAAEGSRNDGAMDTGLYIVKALMEDFEHMQPSAWVYWQAIEDSLLDHNYGFIRVPFDGKEEYAITKSFHILRQITKYIRPGMKIMKYHKKNMIIAKDKKSKVVIILNDSSEKVRYSIKDGYDVKNVIMIITNEKSNHKEEKVKVVDQEIKIELKPNTILTMKYDIM